MWLDIQIFGFRALWTPYFFLFVVLLSVAYYMITVRFRHYFGVSKAPSASQQFFFYAGMVLLYIAKGSPADLLSHIMLSAHMTQLAIYFLIFPIFMIQGIPVWIWDWFVHLRVINPIVKLVTRPIISLLLFNALFSFYHIPTIFNFSQESQVAHTSFGLIILIAAFIVWFPILTPLKEFNTIPPLVKIGYVFLNGILITPACVLIIFANDPLYAAYIDDGAWMQALALCVPPDVLEGLSGSISGPEMFSSLSVMNDQQLGGIIMKITQEIVYMSVIAYIFFPWFNRENLQVDPLPETQ